GNRAEYRYDRRGLLVERRTATGKTLRLDYDGMARLIRLVDEVGRETRIERTGHGTPTRIVHPDKTEVRYRFNAENDVVGVLNESGGEFKIVRDGKGRVLEETDYFGTRRTFAYDATGLITDVVTGSGARLHVVEDAMGQVTERRLADG